MRPWTGCVASRVVFPPGQPARFGNFEARKLVISCTAAVNRQARQNAPGGPYSTGRLKASINWSLTRNNPGLGVTATSGSDLIYANSVHGGQPARRIVPVRATYLRFYWRKVGRRVRFLSVNHPGTKAQPYLTDALKTIAPRYGFKVSVISTINYS